VWLVVVEDEDVEDEEDEEDEEEDEQDVFFFFFLFTGCALGDQTAVCTRLRLAR
jgi:hypothetical protein